jgi:hypothetical protein
LDVVGRGRLVDDGHTESVVATIHEQ